MWFVWEGFHDQTRGTIIEPKKKNVKWNMNSLSANVTFMENIHKQEIIRRTSQQWNIQNWTITRFQIVIRTENNWSNLYSVRNVVNVLPSQASWKKTIQMWNLWKSF